jgi:HAD superfamily hydrolase (TIGR01549 family)
MQRIGIPQTDEMFQEARSLVKASLPLLHPSARSRLLYFKKYLELKNEFSAERLLTLSHLYEEQLCKLLQAHWKDLHRDSLLTKLKAKFKKIAVLTNETLRMQSLKLKSFDPHGIFFDMILTSEEVGSEKPSSVFFQRALKILGAQPEDCVMVGDSYDKDIAPCQPLGIAAIKTTEFIDDQKTNEFHSVITKLDQLLEEP